MPPGLGLSSIAPKESPSGVPEEKPSEQPMPPEPSGSQALTREELERGMDLMQALLDDRLTDEEKRQRAQELSAAAGVPWRKKRNDSRGLLNAPRHKNKFGFSWCDCCDGESCPSENPSF